MSDDFEVFFYHVDVVASQVAVEFRRRTADGSFEPPDPAHAVHILPLTPTILRALQADIHQILSVDLAELRGVRSRLLTSELHHLREARAVSTKTNLEAKATRDRISQERRDHQISHEKAMNDARDELATVQGEIRAEREALAQLRGSSGS